eukprot:jgi/Chlat1/1886/Chrsp145S02206
MWPVQGGGGSSSSRRPGQQGRPAAASAAHSVIAASLSHLRILLVCTVMLAGLILGYYIRLHVELRVGVSSASGGRVPGHFSPGDSDDDTIPSDSWLLSEPDHRKKGSRSKAGDGTDIPANASKQSGLRQLQYTKSGLIVPPHLADILARKEVLPSRNKEPSDIAQLSLEQRATSPSMCGNWQHKYARWHKRAMASLSNPKAAAKTRFVVFRCRQVGEVNEQCGGLADRFTGMVSAFLFALLTDRVFLIDWPGYENAFNSPYANLTYVPEILGQPSRDKLLPVMPWVPLHPRWGVNVTGLLNGDVGMYNWHDCEVRRRFDNCGGAFAGHLGHLNSYFQEKVVVINFNRGVVSMAFRETGPQMRLQAMGLHPDTAFGCLLHFIMRPSSTVHSLFARYSQVLDDPTVFSVGIHIRTGDSSFQKNANLTVLDHDEYGTQFQEYFETAQVLADYHAQPGQRVVWYVMSDNKALKDDARRRYTSRMLTTDIEAAHIDREIWEKAAREGKKKDPNRSLQESLGEWWLLSKCKYFVLKRTSGFSRTALAYSLRPEVAAYPGTGPFYFMRTIELAELGAGL